MAIEQFANAATTTVGAGGIDNSSTSLLVTSSAAPFPQIGNFRILIDNEIMLVTAVPNSTHFTVTRGAEGTSAASHSAGNVVTHIMTAGSLNQFRADTVQSGAVANRPAAGVAGRIYTATDDSYLFVDTGSTWLSLGPVYSLNPPAWTGYAWTNQGTASLVARTNGSTTMISPSQNGDNLRMWLKSYPATPFTYTAGITSSIFGNNNNNRCGIVVYNSSNGKAVDLSLYATGPAVQPPAIICGKWNSYSSYNANYILLNGNSSNPLLTGLMPASILFLRYNDDGINRNFSISVDNLNYTLLLQTTNSDFTTVDQIGVYVNGNNNGGSGTTLTMTILHLVG